MSQIEAVVNQEQLTEEMQRLLASGRDKKTPDYIQRKLDALEEYWNEFPANHKQSPFFKHIYVESATKS
ncbi:unnamed protein product [Arctia plantaginis]|uniref:Uncharacterized protein n=1 Tax=Arctia plantaginis TaxID=874455 RepID=A0A8S0YX30_ARCPL|nr:unnamed protein product [Arctia plantaginis]